eukprot:697459-Rhodomonas_salina.1
MGVHDVTPSRSVSLARCRTGAIKNCDQSVTAALGLRIANDSGSGSLSQLTAAGAAVATWRASES